MKYNLVEFFVGAGGSHLGFMQEGFATLYANDFDSNALQTLEFNNKKHLKNAILDGTDITQICPKEFHDPKSKIKINLELRSRVRPTEPPRRPLSICGFN